MIYAGSTKAPWRTPYRLFVGGGVALGLFILLTVLTDHALIVFALAGLAAVAAVAWRWAPWAAVGFGVFTPVNRVVVALVLHYTGSDLLTKLIQVWKEGLIAVLLLRVVYDAVQSRSGVRLRYLDILVVAFIVLTGIYLLYPGTQNVEQFTKIQGFRTDASFLFAFLAGRGLRLNRRHVRWLLLGLIPGTLASSAVAFWQFLSPATAIAAFQSLGISDPAGTLTGTAAQTFEVVRGRGIGTDLVRAASFQFGDLALAFFQVILVAVAAGLLSQARTTRERALATAFLLLMIGTMGITVTRSAAVALVPVLMVVAILGRSFGRTVLALGIAAVGTYLAIGMSGYSLDSIAQLSNPGEASALGHYSALERSLAIIQATPFGEGLGTAGTIGQRYLGQLALTNESWFLQLGTEMGLLAALLFAGVSIATILTCMGVYRQIQDAWLRSLVLGVLGGQVGLLVVGNFLHSWENTVLSMLVWLLTGVAVSANRVESSPGYGAEP